MLLQRVTNAITSTKIKRPSRLRILHDDGVAPGPEIPLPAAGVVLGADAACDVVLTDPAVSRKHVTIVPADAGFDVTDLGSRNGTWLDGAKLTRATVPPGSTLRIGTSLVQMLPAEEPVDIPPSVNASFGAMLGSSDAMRRVFAVLERASVSDAPVLLLGESGTGKELAARAVHDASKRREGPFVVFDCGAASESLVESTLFGHKRGAFTGAHADHPGAFALAHGGTLFLDEIGDLPLAMQPKLLRMLERGEVTPLGGRKSETYDVRFVAATHRDLPAEVARGAFRADLYYRLAVVEVILPPLRQRRSDIPEIVRAMLRSHGADDAHVGGPSLERLLAYAWPGNVRELRNVIARAAALATPGAKFTEMPVVVRADASAMDPEPLGRADVPYHDAKDALLARFDREYCTDLLRRANGNLSQAARLAGLERKYLYKVLERAGLRSSSDAGDDD
ncbi:MAG: sigma 54-dependent Fis family transcriptional regulator [Deltaproteobacteria bacterium]|nr:sigma 54-dependent Fis family transcriptional regulator [Deltaproteobacteria bacterium]